MFSYLIYIYVYIYIIIYFFYQISFIYFFGKNHYILYYHKSLLQTYYQYHDFVAQEDIPLVRSLAISQSLHHNSFCWTFAKGNMNIIKSECWVTKQIYIFFCHWTKQIFKIEENTVDMEPSITKFQSFVWMINLGQSTVHLMQISFELYPYSLTCIRDQHGKLQKN